MAGVRPHQRTRLGVARTFQRLEVFGSLSVRENVLVAAEVHRKWDKTGDARRRRWPTSCSTGSACARWPSGASTPCPPAWRGSSSWPGRWRRSRSCCCSTSRRRASTSRSPTSSARLLPELAADGLGVLLVEHDVELVMKVCNRIHVLDFGRILAVGTPREIQANKTVQAAYLGGGGVDLDETGHHSTNGKAKPKSGTSRR